MTIVSLHHRPPTFLAMKLMGQTQAIANVADVLAQPEQESHLSGPFKRFKEVVEWVCHSHISFVVLNFSGCTGSAHTPFQGCGVEMMRLAALPQTLQIAGSLRLADGLIYSLT